MRGDRFLPLCLARPLRRLFIVWSARHSLALGALFFGGCFLNHQSGPTPDPGRDAGIGIDSGLPIPDAGGPSACFASDGFVGHLGCPDGEFGPGDFAEVDVQHYPGGCCSRGTSVVDVDASGATWTLTPRWVEVCDCCDVCDCIGPVAGDTVRIGPLLPGGNTVRAGGFECTIFAGLTGSTCEVVPAEARSARLLFPDQTDDVTLTHLAGADCDCTPGIEGSGADVGLALCHCQESCEDVITPYQGRAIGPVRPVGDYTRRVGGTELPLSVRDVASCQPLTATSLRVELPDTNAVRVGPPLVWIGVDTLVDLCDDALVGARSEVAPDGAIDLTVFEYARSHIFCGSDTPVPVTAWHSLGPLPPGDYVVLAGAQRARFRVP